MAQLRYTDLMRFITRVIRAEHLYERLDSLEPVRLGKADQMPIEVIHTWAKLDSLNPAVYHGHVNSHGHDIHHGHVKLLCMPHQQNRRTGFVHLLAKALQKAGWQVEQPPESADPGADIVARQGKKTYVFELKASSEARKDRAIPLISQAILEAQTAAGRVSARAIPVPSWPPPTFQIL